MNSLIDVLELRPFLEESRVDLSSENFEAIYSALASDPTREEVRAELDRRVRNYFGALELPEGVTLYDELLLSLRDKDLVATFNWDPFLVQAYRRVADLGRAPRIVFLHGSVAVGYCEQDRIAGNLGEKCAKCGERFTPSPLLYPVADKRYRDHPFLASQWTELEERLSDAYVLSIFGYSAPVSDAAAVGLMRKAWDTNGTRTLAQIEIVDIRPEEELLESWRPFIVRQHYGIAASIDQTLAFRYARRSCDAFAGATLMIAPWRESPLPRHESLSALRAAVRPLIEEERLLEEKGRAFDTGVDSPIGRAGSS
ncbi:MAG TPA: hypothetical protein VFK04_04970 [Gemmatimonadaceae bacterium]|nr:hypothetical protein [Gemmatimonadaceae bacterium]